MIQRSILLAAAFVLTAAPAVAQSKKPDRPMTDNTVTATDVAATPMDTLNLRKKNVPEVLISAQEDPYTLRGLRGCAQISRAVRNLDGVLGDDIDVAQAKGKKLNVGRIAQAGISSFIPFNGLIKEISGANAQERAVQSAIYAGSVRRAFLKGVGQTRGCPHPARSAG